jgi:glycosyl transferase, family 25
MSVNESVDAVLVLSVRSFSERIAHIQAELARHRIDFEFMFDFDADAIPTPLIERTFAPSDLQLTHQSLVLKHIRSWQLTVERGWRRVLVLEDDAVLTWNFESAFAQAMREADALVGPYLIYLGCGDNRYLQGAKRSAHMLLPGGSLPATDSLVFNCKAAEQRLAYLTSHKITRPADWLMREMDAAVGIPHYWLRSPIVEQGSMNGLFQSVLDDKRKARGRWYSWLRYRWNKFRQNALGGRTVESNQIADGSS